MNGHLHGSGTSAPRDLRTERLLATILFGLLILGCIWILLPFATALLWAVILCFATWTIYTQLREALGGRRNLAALLLTLLQLVVIVIPMAAVVIGLREYAATIEDLLRQLAARELPAVPPWVAGLPFVGGEIARQWDYLRGDSAQLFELMRLQVAPLTRGLIDAGMAFGGGLLQLLLSVITSFFLYRDGEYVAQEMRTALTRIGGQRAERMLIIAGNTVRGVIYGVIGTSLAQAMLSALGFWVAGVPAPLLLGLLTFLLAPLPMGTPLVWGGAAIWLFNEGQVMAAVGMVIWGGVFVSTIDNILRPIIIGAGARLPFMLVLLGVVGGLLAFGLIGLFFGPTLLALGYNLLREWTQSAPEADAPLAPAVASPGPVAAAATPAPQDPIPKSPAGGPPTASTHAIPDPGHDTEEPS